MADSGITREVLIGAAERYERNLAEPHRDEYQALMKQLLLRAVTLGIRQGEFHMKKGLCYSGEPWDSSCIEYIFARLKQEGFKANINQKGYINVMY